MNLWRNSKFLIPYALITFGCVYFFERSVDKQEIKYPINSVVDQYNSTGSETIRIDNVKKRHKIPNLISQEEFDRDYKLANRNFPLNLFQKEITYFDPDGCIKFPNVLDLRFSNTYWQTLKFKRKTNAYILSAYYDNRDLVEKAPVIRIITTLLKVDVPMVKYCQLWFPDEKKVILSDVSSAFHMDPWNYHAHTYIVTCDIPSKNSAKVPAAVSLVEDKCDSATNVLPVHYNLPENNGVKKDFAICMRALYNPKEDLSLILVQYIELANILGVDKIYIYNHALSPNMSEVLRYYSNQNRVEVIPVSLPGIEPNVPEARVEVIKRSSYHLTLYARVAHNDCLYMNMYKYKYIAFFDIDELMIPANGKSWKDVIDQSIKTEQEIKGNKYKPPSVYLTEAGEFLEKLRINWTPGIPHYISMLQNIYRSDIISEHTKPIADTERILGIGGHLPMECIGKCIGQRLKTSLAILGHFKISSKRCNRPSNHKMCEGRRDTQIWEYKEAMIKQVNEALVAIGLL